MKDRLSKFIISEGLTPSMLADEMGVHRSGISHILTGRNNARFDFIKKLLERFPKLNAEWLILGQGAMYKSSEKQTIDLFSVEKTPLSPTLPEKPQIFASVEGDINSQHDTIPEILPSAEPKKSSKKNVEKTIIFYSDKTFELYLPEP